MMRSRATRIMMSISKTEWIPKPHGCVATRETEGNGYFNALSCLALWKSKPESEQHCQKEPGCKERMAKNYFQCFVLFFCLTA